MVKTATPNLTENANPNAKLAKRQLNPNVSEPCEETILNILNYSKALSVKDSAKAGKIANVMN